MNDRTNGSNFHLPGQIQLDQGLLARFGSKREERGTNYRPRTHHLDSKGQAIYTNRLFLESSPYLLQHAHNPVNWYPWGEEAFETAAQLNRPVLVSIGYSTCHWCHVMEEESFEDEEIAAYLNTHFITVKVDREERPDVDAIYMAAVQALNGNGGWPLNVMLMPGKKPFWGGTYFPARDGDRGVNMGFLSILKRIHEVFQSERDQLDRTSHQLTEAIESMLAPGAEPGVPSPDLLDQAAAFYKDHFDSVNGGLAGAPKFPSSLPLRFLLRYSRRSGRPEFLQMVEQTLEKMGAGGMYDQAGGGFHRYSVDAGWQVPHFEKMLYDNALLVLAYLEGYQVTGKKRYRQITEEILRYVSRDMTTPQGAFYSATDADSLTLDGRREEGIYFTWTPEELEEVLGAEQVDMAREIYQVRPGGNFEGRSILNRPVSLADQAASRSLTVDEMEDVREEINAQLYVARKSRPAPIRDEKVLTAWNGLMISAFARAGRVLKEQSYIDRAQAAAEFVLENLCSEGDLLRSFNDNQASLNGYLEDYAFLMAGLLDLHEATQENKWFHQVVELDRLLIKRFEDQQMGGFFMTADNHEKLIAREKPNSDGATPSGNSVALMNLLRMGALTGTSSYRERFQKAFNLFLGSPDRNPVALSEMLLAVDFATGHAREIVIVTPTGQRQKAEPFLDLLRSRFLPNAVLSLVEEGDEDVLPVAAGKIALDGKVTAYVCEFGTCRQPVTDPEKFVQELDNRS